MTRESAIVALDALEQKRDRFARVAAGDELFTAHVLRTDRAIREIIADFGFPAEWYVVPRDRALSRTA